MARTFDRYKQNLSIVTTSEGDFIKSYDTLVAKINHETRTIEVLGYWSKTTTIHINYVANKFSMNQEKKY